MRRRCIKIKQRIKSVGFTLYKATNMNVKFKVSRFNKENEFYYKEFIYEENEKYEEISSLLEPNSYIQITLNNYALKQKRSIPLFINFQKIFIDTIRGQIKIFDEYDKIDNEQEKNEFELFQTTDDDNIIINKKYSEGMKLTLYNTLFLKIYPTVIRKNTGFFPGIKISYNDQISFKYDIGQMKTMLDIIEKVDYNAMALQLLQFSPPINYGGFTIRFKPDVNIGSTVASGRTKKDNIFGNIKTY